MKKITAKFGFVKMSVSGGIGLDKDSLKFTGVDSKDEKRDH
jgi:hypothetical protein